MTYSTAKIVEKTRRNGEIGGERKVVSASIRPTAPMLSSVGSAARPRTSTPPFVMPATKAIAAAIATLMLNGLTTGHSPRWRGDDIGRDAAHKWRRNSCPNLSSSGRQDVSDLLRHHRDDQGPVVASLDLTIGQRNSEGPSLRHRDPPMRPPSGVEASVAGNFDHSARRGSKVSCSRPDGTPADRSDGSAP